VHGRTVQDLEAVEELDTAIRRITSTIVDVRVVTDLAGISLLVDQAFDLVGAFDFWRAVGVAGGLLGFQKLLIIR
jgi:hypothetical protein